MGNEYKDYHVIASASGILHSERAGNRNVEKPRDLPGITIFIHGVNDPGAVYETVETGLNQGLNERLSRTDLNKGEYGSVYKAVKAKPKNKLGKNDARILYDPEMYLYKRGETPGVTRSGFIPFYWGYRAASDEIAKVNDAGDVKGAIADANGNLMTRGQYQDKKGNRLDAHFAKPGGFFANATNNIPDMYGAGFRADWKARGMTENNVLGNTFYAADGPARRYFILAAERLAQPDRHHPRHSAYRCGRVSRYQPQARDHHGHRPQPRYDHYAVGPSHPCQEGQAVHRLFHHR